MMTIASYTLIEALRNRMLWIVALIAILGFCLSLFLQQIAIAESRQIQSGALALTIRLGGVFVMSSFVVTGMLREYHDKGLEFFLAMPMDRVSYFLGKLLGYAACSLMLAAILGAPLFWSSTTKTVLIWGISLFFELLTVSSASLFFSLSLKQIPAALAAVFGFYLLSRIMGTLVLIMHGPLSDHGLLHGILDAAISSIGFFLPHLDDFARTAWIVYPEPGWRDLLPSAAQAAIYVILMSCASLFDFYRREL